MSLQKKIERKRMIVKQMAVKVTISDDGVKLLADSIIHLRDRVEEMEKQLKLMNHYIRIEQTRSNI